LSSGFCERDGSDLTQQGLFIDLPAWGYHLLEGGVTI
jgi:hypothetical protein